MKPLALIASMALAAAALAGPAQAGKAADEAALTAHGDRWNAAYSAGNWQALRALYADDAWLMTDKAPAAKGADAIIAYLQRFRSRGATVSFRFAPEHVEASGRFGFVIARYWMTAQLPGGAAPIRTAGRSMLVYKKQGREWKLWRDIDNTSPDVPVE